MHAHQDINDEGHSQGSKSEVKDASNHFDDPVLKSFFADIQHNARDEDTSADTKPHHHNENHHNANDEIDIVATLHLEQSSRIQASRQSTPLQHSGQHAGNLIASELPLLQPIQVMNITNLSQN